MRFLTQRLFKSTATNLTRNPLVDKVLIANRGEIACRVMQTCKRLGVRTVAVYSDIDRNARHVQMADEAYCIGAAPSSESYLRGDKILEIARLTNAQAIHPGYGFLSENANFAKQVEEAGVHFIGPPASAIVAMGSKSESKNIMSKAGVPVVPGYHGDNQDPQHLLAEASKMQYPVLIKAIKGGGGKGMRIVTAKSEFLEMLDSARREAKKSFGDDRVLVEKYLLKPRHVEVQVFCDKFGGAVYLFERDCSVQRRHQKIIEEAPAPHLSEELRRDLGEKAVAAAKAVGYVGAGTVEFIMNEDGKFYFMEMNTRLQVEHCVTEMITGTDLVEWQLEVASGNPLPRIQEQLFINGHSFETRIYAENPRNNFLPDTGKLVHIRTPAVGSTVRVETGVRQGDQVSVFYDPMIAKLVVWGKDRTTALQKLRQCLGEYQVVGPQTNIDFLKTLSAHPAFIAGEVETGFIKKHEEELFKTLTTPDPLLVMQAAVSMVFGEIKSLMHLTSESPWSTLANFRLNSTPKRVINLWTDEMDKSKSISIPVSILANTDGSFKVEVLKKSFTNIRLSMTPASEYITFQTDDGSYKSQCVVSDEYINVFSSTGETLTMRTSTGGLEALSEQDGSASIGSVKSPMPCKISQVMCKPGQVVKKGQPLVVLEAMKMEHVIRAPMDGIVDRIPFAMGQLVEENKVLVVFQEEKK